MGKSLIIKNTTFKAVNVETVYPSDNKVFIRVKANNSDYGEVVGENTYNKGDQIQISASAAEGYKFVSWSDGSTVAFRTLEATESTTYTANFAALEAGEPLFDIPSGTVVNGTSPLELTSLLDSKHTKWTLFFYATAYNNVTGHLFYLDGLDTTKYTDCFSYQYQSSSLKLLLGVYSSPRITTTDITTKVAIKRDGTTLQFSTDGTTWTTVDEPNIGTNNNKLTITSSTYSDAQVTVGACKIWAEDHDVSSLF